jgi:hypothetical protein
VSAERPSITSGARSRANCTSSRNPGADAGSNADADAGTGVDAGTDADAAGGGDTGIGGLAAGGAASACNVHGRSASAPEKAMSSVLD